MKKPLPPMVEILRDLRKARAQIARLREVLTASLNQAELTYEATAYSKEGLIRRLLIVAQEARAALAEEEA